MVDPRSPSESPIRSPESGIQFLNSESVDSARQAKHRIIGALILSTFVVSLVYVIVRTSPRESVVEPAVIAKADSRQVVGEQTVDAIPRASDRVNSTVQDDVKVAPPRAVPPTILIGDRSHVAVGSLPVAGNEKRALEKQHEYSDVAVATKVRQQARPSSTLPLAKPLDRIMIQIAAVGSRAKANELSSKLKHLGYQSSFEPVKTAKGELIRVRVGPFGSLQLAEEANRRLSKKGMPGLLAN